jgi:uncharacterized membrane protein YkoI
MKSIALLLFVCLASPAFAAPHISIADARKIALARVPGTIVHEKLKKHKKKKKKKEEEHDHYNIKIAPATQSKKGMVKKVEIDADTGQVLEIKDVKAKSYDD